MEEGCHQHSTLSHRLHSRRLYTHVAPSVKLFANKEWDSLCFLSSELAYYCVLFGPLIDSTKIMLTCFYFEMSAAVG